MAQQIFIDATAWVALFWHKDSNHSRASDWWKETIKKDWLLFTSNWTLYEAATFLASRLGRHDWAVELLDRAYEGTIILKADKVEQEAIDTFRSHADKQWSVVDCANFHALRRHGCERAFAFDGHFRQAQGEFGFTVLS